MARSVGLWRPEPGRRSGLLRSDEAYGPWWLDDRHSLVRRRVSNSGTGPAMVAVVVVAAGALPGSRLTDIGLSLGATRRDELGGRVPSLPARDRREEHR